MHRSSVLGAYHINIQKQVISGVKMMMLMCVWYMMVQKLV